MALHNPFSLDASDVERLNEVEQVNLFNRLIANRGLRLGLGATQIKTTLRVHDPDAGIDAQTDLGSLHDAFLDTGLTVWQFKASWPAERKLRQELQKSGVQDAFKQGAGYALVVGTGIAVGGHHGQGAREKRLDDLAKEYGCSRKVRLLVADNIATWISEDPAALFEIRPEIRGLMRVDQVLERDKRHSIKYEFDDQRTAIAEAIQAWLNDPNPSRLSIRVQGVAGVGKTRLALESIKRAGLASTVLYSPGVPESIEFFGWVESNDRIQAILIIDECDEFRAQDDLESRVRYCDGRLRLITLGPGMARNDVYVLGVLDDAAMKRVVQEAALGLPPEQLRWVVDKTRGFVKLAVVVAQALAMRGIQHISDMPRDSQIAGLVQRMLIPSEEGRLALQGIALLTRVGFRDDVDVEGKVIASFMGVDWNRMQWLLQPAIDQGIISTRGRYWYVSPELLALWLTADFWRTQNHRIPELQEILPSSESQVAFQERLGALGEIPEAKEVLEQALSPQGPFPTIESLDSPRVASLFAALTRAAPEAGVEAARRLVQTATREQLMAFRSGRREFTWALEHLLEGRETFHQAIRTIRRLAETENEDFSNNATGVWSDAFLTVLAETEVPFLERMSILEEALTDADPETRRLGAIGLASALEGQESKLLRGTKSGVPRPHWQPQTYSELRELKRRPLGLLRLVLNDPDGSIREQARGVLRDSLRPMAELGLTTEWVELANLIQKEGDAERRSMWSAIMLTLEFAKNYLTEEQGDLLQIVATRYFGNSFSDRIQRYLGPSMHANVIETEESWNDALKELAREAYESPDALRSLLPWLVSGEAEQLWPFALELGRLDQERVWFKELLVVAVGAADHRILSGYLVGRAEAGGDSEAQWREDVLEKWAGERSFAGIAWDGTVQGAASDRGALRLLRLAESGWIDPSALAVVRYGDWKRATSPDVATRLLQELMKAGTPSSIVAALSIVEWRLANERGDQAGIGNIRAVAWELLEHRAGWSHEPMLMWIWKRVGDQLVKHDPGRMAQIVLDVEVAGQPAFQDERLKLLEQAAQLEPQRVWRTIGDALLQASTSHQLTWELRKIGLLTRLPADVIHSWIQQKGAQAAVVVAPAVSIESPPFPDLARLLLRDWGNEVGRELASNFLSGVWTGFAESYWSQKLEFAKQLLQDPEPAVADWATGLVDALRTEVRAAKQFDEEHSWV